MKIKFKFHPTTKRYLKQVLKMILPFCFVAQVVMGCRSDQEIKRVAIQEDSIISQFGDTIFFTSMHGIVWDSEQMVFPTMRSLIVTDLLFRPISYIPFGKRGSNNLGESVSVHLTQKGVIALDNTSLDFKRIDLQGSVLERHAMVDKSLVVHFCQRFSVVGDDVFYGGEKGVYRYNMSTEINTLIATASAQQILSVFSFQDDLLVLDHHTFEIRKISKEHPENVVSFNTDHPDIEKTKAMLQSNNGGKFMMVNDAYLSESKLYLLVASFNETDQKYQCRDVIVFNIDNGSLETKQFVLPDRVYTSLMIKEYQLIAFSYTAASLGIFDIGNDQ